MPQYRQCLGQDGNINPDQIYEIESLAYIPRGSSAWDVYEQWVIDGGVTLPPEVFTPSDEQLAIDARQLRESLLRSTYDPGIMMALRALRMASTPEETAYAEGKIAELDAYAELLLAIPNQAGFPQTITWPAAPTK